MGVPMIMSRIPAMAESSRSWPSAMSAREQENWPWRWSPWPATPTRGAPSPDAPRSSTGPITGATSRNAGTWRWCAASRAPGLFPRPWPKPSKGWQRFHHEDAEARTNHVRTVLGSQIGCLSRLRPPCPWWRVVLTFPRADGGGHELGDLRPAIARAGQPGTASHDNCRPLRLLDGTRLPGAWIRTWTLPRGSARRRRSRSPRPCSAGMPTWPAPTWTAALSWPSMATSRRAPAPSAARSGQAAGAHRARGGHIDAGRRAGDRLPRAVSALVRRHRGRRMRARLRLHQPPCRGVGRARSGRRDARRLAGLPKGAGPVRRGACLRSARPSARGCGAVVATRLQHGRPRGEPSGAGRSAAHARRWWEAGRRARHSGVRAR